MLFGRGDTTRFSVHGYVENGSTTTPFDMHIRNGTSRYQIAIEVLDKMATRGVIERKKADELISDLNNRIKEHREYIIKNGEDPVEVQ